MLAMIVCQALSLSAQNIWGLAFRSSSVPFVVYINNVQVSELTNSCFVANPPQGHCYVRVAIPADNGWNNLTTIFNSTVSPLRGQITRINLDEYIDGQQGYPNPNDRFGQVPPQVYYGGLVPIDPRSYETFRDRVSRCTFKSDYERAMRFFPRNVGITSAQFAQLCRMPTFDDERKIIARALIPQVIDLQNLVDMESIFDFTSNQREVEEQILRELQRRGNR